MGYFWLGWLMMVFCMLVGIMEMFREYYVDLEGKYVVIIGRFNIVGKLMV